MQTVDPAVLELIQEVDAFAADRKVAPSTVSLWIFSQGSTVERLRQGQVSVTLRRLHSAKRRLAELREGVADPPPWPQKPRRKAAA